MEVNEIITYTFTGDVQEFVAPVKGIYKLEVWGAQGGYRSSTSTGGLGGYASGQITLKSKESISIYVGGNGQSAGRGWNGGGTAGYSGIYGGGASDIRYNGTELANRILVAGGGGSCGGTSYAGGYGGGTNGGSVTSGYGSGGGGATQSAGGSGSSSYPLTVGSLGQGGRGYSANSGYGGAGGGGYYGGGGTYPDTSGDDDKGGGGGSGYVNTSILTNTSLIAGNASMPSPGSTTTTITGRSGHGYCRITLIEKLSTPVYVNINGTYKESISYVNVNGVYKEAEPFINLNGQWLKI